MTATKNRFNYPSPDSSVNPFVPNTGTKGFTLLSGKSSKKIKKKYIAKPPPRNPFKKNSNNSIQKIKLQLPIQPKITTRRP